MLVERKEQLYHGWASQKTCKVILKASTSLLMSHWRNLAKWVVCKWLRSWNSGGGDNKSIHKMYLGSWPGRMPREHYKGWLVKMSTGQTRPLEREGDKVSKFLWIVESLLKILHRGPMGWGWFHLWRCYWPNQKSEAQPVSRTKHVWYCGHGES